MFVLLLYRGSIQDVFRFDSGFCLLQMGWLYSRMLGRDVHKILCYRFKLPPGIYLYGAGKIVLPGADYLYQRSLMANQEQLKLIKEGVQIWNAWRKMNPSIRVDLSGGNFSSMELSGVDLDGANLQDVNFNKADLSGAMLSGANLTESSLMEANLTGANLKNANVSEADLLKAILVRANLERAHLAKTDLTGADVTEANLTDANLHLTNLQSAKLIRANLEGSKLREANMVQADLAGANLASTDLAQSNLRQANVCGANVEKASMIQVNLQEADLQAVQNITIIQLSKARSLLNARLDPPISEQVAKEYPHLFVQD
ncbi:MAG TPA: hypothetical protein DD706_08840 [Nitrospiraceae bacterium]|nr:hypothetical protein [Nitrospiraceae bacterium]